MTVAGKNTITLKNVLVGEVWLCSGQSNMDMGMNQVLNSKEEVAAANYPSLRLFEVSYKTSWKEETNCDGAWKECVPEGLGSGGFFGTGFSGVGYYFGRRLHEELDVPVGLIKTAWGGTRIEPWTPPEGFELDPQFAPIVERIHKATPKHRDTMAKLLPEVEAYIAKARAALDSGDELPAPPPWPRHELDDAGQPTGIYNAMIRPLVPFAIRGAIWYQGESNRDDGLLYTDRMKALVGGWRKIWNQGDFPFYFVQIAPYRYQDHPEWTLLLWESQARAMAIPNTGMVVTTDLVDNIEDIHPRNKKDVGERLALWALAKTYAKPGVVYSGPLYDSMQVDGKQIRVKFQYADGLKSRDGKPLSWFQIAGADRNFVKAKAKIDSASGTVIVSSGEVKEPVAVRFAWDQEAMPNLVNGARLPAAPFRTDNW
jgi:sialate O-acetylesterase